MAELVVRAGVNPAEPDVPAVVVVVDPEGTAGEQAVVRLGDYCYEGDEVLYFSQTDGWTVHSFDGGRLVVDVLVYPSVLERLEIDAEPFPGRSGELVSLLSVAGEVDAELYAQVDPGTAVFPVASGESLDAAIASDEDWPILMALPPEE